MAELQPLLPSHMHALVQVQPVHVLAAGFVSAVLSLVQSSALYPQQPPVSCMLRQL